MCESVQRKQGRILSKNAWEFYVTMNCLCWSGGLGEIKKAIEYLALLTSFSLLLQTVISLTMFNFVFSINFIFHFITFLELGITQPELTKHAQLARRRTGSKK